MSLNQVQTELKHFQKDLERFNSAMASSVRSLQRSHESVAGIWQDDFRKQYDQRWNEFGKHMNAYLGREAGRYSAFLSLKIQQIGRYLHG